MSAQRPPMYENPGAAERGRGQYGDRVDGCAATACTSAYCKHRQEKSPVQQFLPPPPASPRQRQPSPSARMSAPSPSPCASSGPGQGSSPWTPTTPRKRKRGTCTSFSVLILDKSLLKMQIEMENGKGHFLTGASLHNLRNIQIQGISFFPSVFVFKQIKWRWG